jgi:uncharacterized protein (TIGR00255 family)
MIYSMTAFARKEIKAEWGTAVWEVRSVNHRYLETFIRLPEQFRGIEALVREKLRAKLQRGKVECNLKFNANAGAVGELAVNKTLASQLLDAGKWVQNQGGEAVSPIDPTDILRWPGVLEAEETDVDEIQQHLLAGFDAVLNDFIGARKDEGENLGQFIQQRLDGIGEQAAFVRSKMPEILAWQKEKLTKRFEEAKMDLESERLEQEMILLAQKTDVAEELDRLDSHIQETQKILKKGGAIGRRLDFMMQEFNRESNTLASKSISSDITNSAVELKVLIEQMREQIQNIE